MPWRRATWANLSFNQLTTFPVSRNASTYEVSSSQSISSPQRSKRVKENTPPRCAMVHNSPACSTSVTCGWGDVATSTTRERQRQTIIIPDTPSPAVSVITISSDTDEEEEQKHAPTRWAVALCTSLCAGERGTEEEKWWSIPGVAVGSQELQLGLSTQVVFFLWEEIWWGGLDTSWGLHRLRWRSLPCCTFAVWPWRSVVVSHL